MKTIEQKRQEAETRQAAARSPQEQLKHLDSLGLAAKKERAKIAKRLSKQQEKRA